MSASSPGGNNGIAVGGTRYIFADSAAGWSAVCTVADTPWRLRYMVTRLDGYWEDDNSDGLPDDVKAIIDRACAANGPGRFVLDEAIKLDSGQTISANVFQDARNALVSIVGSSAVTWDRSATFLTRQSNVIGYVSWGLHDYYANSYTTLGRPLNTWANGGIGVVLESTDGRAFHLPYYAWGLSKSGTAYANKLSLTGWWTSGQYTGYKLALLDSAGTQLASGILSAGSVQINLTGVNWPADHRTYVELYFPSNDPLHPGGPIEHARYPWSSPTTEVYDNRTAGFPLIVSPCRNQLSEMLREGASGGMANTDEPWTSYVGDPAYLFPRYAQGYTFAESAFMCMPGMGWQEVAVGDPMMAPYATPPNVSISSPPADGQVVTGTFAISANATPNGSSGIARVEFWLDDDTLLASDTTAPYTVSLDTTALADGLHSIEAVAFENDAVGNAGSAARTFISNNNGLIRSDASDLAALPDGTAVGLQGKVVSAAFDGCFYVEDSDRAHGIRVRSDVPVTEGSTVTVTGKLATLDGEREIVADGVFVTGP